MERHKISGKSEFLATSSQISRGANHSNLEASFKIIRGGERKKREDYRWVGEDGERVAA